MPDYMFMLESRLSAEQRAAVMRIQELAASTESNVYLSGGAVRDLISGMPIRDLDFIVEGQPGRIARELEKGGARIVSENDSLRSIELILSGDVDASLSAARDEVYSRPGTRPEFRFSTIMEDLRRRDFSLNAIAISLNPNSRGLLLDPTNGLADLERQEIRALSIHSFTNQPVRLLRALRYAARMGFKMESRTADWFELAMERGLQNSIPPAAAGHELRHLAREEKPAAILKAWESRGLLDAVHPQLARRHPDYNAIQRIIKVRDDLTAAGFRPRLFAPMTIAILGRLKQRERTSIFSRLEYRAAEIDAITHFEDSAQKLSKLLAGRKTAAPRDAYALLDKTPLDLLSYILAEGTNSKVLGKIRSFFFKWKPLRQALPAVAVELEALGLARGPKFDKVLEDFFQAQLLGKARKPEDHIKVLRRLSGIKEQPKKEEKKKPEKPSKKKSEPDAKAAKAAPHAPSEPVAAPAPAKSVKTAAAAHAKPGKPSPHSAQRAKHAAALASRGKSNRARKK